MVPACVTCHDLKDRGGLRGLPAKEGLTAVRRLANLGILGSALLGDPPMSWPEGWDQMNRWERIVWGRVVALAHRGGGRSADLLWSVLAADVIS